MKKKIKKRDKLIIVIALLFLVSGLLLGYSIMSIYGNFNKKQVETIKNPFVLNKFDLENAKVSSINIPAVDNNGKGVSTVLYVSVVPGSGKTLVDIDGLLFWADTQSSIRTAKEVAENITGSNLTGYDIIYHVQAEASLIGGPSAGAAITVATIAALENRELNDKVMITGTINHDGSIGPVSGIVEKASAAKEDGIEIFLVPLLQSQDTVYETKEYCRKFGLTEFCNTETIPKKVDVAQESGIQVKEVSSIQEALEYFYKENVIG